MNNDFKARMVQYEQELLRLRQRSHLPEPTSVASPPPSQDPPSSPASAPPLTPSSFPSHFQGNITQEQNSEGYPRSSAKTPPAASPSPVILTTISVVSAQDESPLTDAIVSIDRRTDSGRQPLHIRFTDRNGTVPSLPIPTGERDARYDIQVLAADHYHELLTGLTEETIGGTHRFVLTPLPQH